MEAKAILRVEKIKNWGQAAAAGGHQSRSRETLNADPGKKNELIIGSGDPAGDLRQRIESADVKIGKRSVIGMDVLLGASPEFFRPWNPGAAGTWDPKRAEVFKSQAVRWAQDYFGEKNVVSAIYHLDESTPHLTLMVAPIDDTPREKGAAIRLNAARWLDGRRRLSDMQTSFANAVARLGLTRGIEGSLATHTSISDFYSAINSAKKIKLTLPQVSTPPLILTPQGREEWAKEKTQEIQGQIKNSTGPLISLANSAAIATQKKEEYQATAEKKTKELRELAAQMRDLDLADVAEALALEQDAHDAHKWHGPSMAVSLTGQKFFDHKRNKGGGGSIDLVMHCMACDYRQAVSWLADRFHGQGAARAVRANAEKIVEAASAERKPFTPPVPAPGAWPAARKYLIGRALDPTVIDSLHSQGLIYATSQASNGYTNVVFLNAPDDPDVAEIRGIATGSKFKGLVAGSKRDSGGFRIRRGKEGSKRLVLCEAPIDAISYYQLHEEGDYIVMSTSGARPDALFVQKALRAGWTIICAYDADQAAGDHAADEMIKRYPEVQRKKPAVGKDWNDQLRQLRAEQTNEKANDESPKIKKAGLAGLAGLNKLKKLMP